MAKNIRHLAVHDIRRAQNGLAVVHAHPLRHSKTGPCAVGLRRPDADVRARSGWGENTAHAAAELPLTPAQR